MINIYTNLARRASGLVAASLLLTASFTAQATAVIDFEDLTESPPGQNNLSFTSGGVAFTALQVRSNNDILSIFDTNCTSAPGANQCTGENPTSGDDGDLAFPGTDTFGLVLVVDDNNPVGPDGSDDEEDGGTILVDFSLPTSVFELTFLDIENDTLSGNQTPDGRSDVDLGDDLAEVIRELDDPNNSNAGTNFVFALLDDEVIGIFDIAAGTAFGAEGNLVTVTDLEGIVADQLVVDFRNSAALAEVVIPVPAAAWLFGTALVGLVGVKRRKA